jgi:hypothetical protein
MQFDEDVLLTSERGEGVVPFRAKQVGQLDHERIFEALRQRLASGVADDSSAAEEG